MKISVVIPAYNEEKCIVDCLKSLRGQTEKPFEIIVCNNNSTDRTAELASKLADKVIFEPRQGVSYALNAGIKAASGDVVAFMGADSVADKDWLRSIRIAFERYNVIGVYGPIYSMNRKSKKYRFVYYFIWHVVSKTLSHTRIAMGPGGNSAFKRDALIKIGGYNPNTIPGEDIELTMKMRKIGKLKFIENAKVYSSTRRFEQSGVWSISWMWIKTFFRIIFKKPKKYNYFNNG
jgi:cellulose synthase/poly-beta-1,6-N-acetylglucosamine synthase-like glycosyltransferase